MITILLNGIVPYFAYVLLKPHLGALTALIVATAVPLGENIVYLARRRSIDAFGLIMLAVFVMSIALVALGGGEKVILARESAVTAMVGCMFLVSLGMRRPLMYHLALRFRTGADPEAQAKFAGRWENPYFRHVLRMMTLGWGVILAGEAVIRTILVFRLSVERFLIVSPIVFYGCLGVVIVWTVAYQRKAKARLNRPV